LEGGVQRLLPAYVVVKRVLGCLGLKRPVTTFR
jgi:hypothetical protein